MEIKNTNGISRIDPADGVKSDTSRGTARERVPQRDGASDQVTLTPAMQHLVHASRAAAESPLDLNRVDRIRAAIAAGRYEVDAERVAAKLMGFERDLPR